MNFNFNSTVNSQNNNQILEGNKIHEVTFEGCVSRDFEGKEPGKMYKVLEIKFKGNTGTFTHTVWQPTSSDFEDTVQWDKKQPSNVAKMAYLLKHLIDTVVPDVADKINKGKLQMSITPDNWDAFRQFIVEHTTTGIGKKTKIKLLKNRKGEATFPYALKYTKNGTLWMSTNFIGDNLCFTSYEQNSINKAEQAQPTSMGPSLETFDMPASVAPSESDDFDLDI